MRRGADVTGGWVAGGVVAGGVVTGGVVPLQALAATWVHGCPEPVGPLAVDGLACVHQLAR